MMNGDQMAEEVLAALEGAGAGTVLTDVFVKAFCGAVVKHIQDNADVKAGIISLGTVLDGAAAGGNVQVTSQLHTVGVS